MVKKIGIVFGLCITLSAWAQEPTSQPQNLSFYNIKPYGFNISFTPAPNTEGYLVLRSSAPVTFSPADGIEYEKGQGVGTDVKVFSSSITSSISIKEVLAGQRYYFAVYAYNGSGIFIDYLNTNPLTGYIDVPEVNFTGYYSNINFQSPTLLTSLKQRLNTGRVFQTYTPGYINNLMNNFYLRDTIGGQVVSECQYTGDLYISTPPYSWWGNASNPGLFTREHAFPRSWMHTGGNVSNQDGADYHNLFPVHQANANSKRSNHPYGRVQNVTYSYLDSKLGTDNQGRTVYEPRNDIKGDVARAQFYMMLCYNGEGGNWGYSNLPSPGTYQDITTLLMWHDQDPPDAFEITRNEYIYSTQYNRNPFIDIPDLSACIDFSNMSLRSDCHITLGLDEQLLSPQVGVFPNPVSGSETLHIQSSQNGIASVRIFNITGLSYKNISGNGAVNLTLSLSDFIAGIYFIDVHLSDGKSTVNKIIIY